MVTAVQLPERLRFLPVFLGLWLLSYLGPHLLAAGADVALLLSLQLGLIAPVELHIGEWVIWVGLLPALYAWAQWLLMRRCLSTAIPWALAVFAGTLLAPRGRTDRRSRSSWPARLPPVRSLVHSARKPIRRHVGDGCVARPSTRSLLRGGDSDSAGLGLAGIKSLAIALDRRHVSDGVRNQHSG